MQNIFQSRSVLILLALLFLLFKKSYSSDCHIRNINFPTTEEKYMIDSKIKALSFKRHGNVDNFTESAEHRIYISGLMDNASVLAAQFGMEYGNGNYEYLIVIDRNKKVMYGPTRIGGSGIRFISIYKVDGLILACAKFYGPNDSTPDPSINGETAFYLGWTGNIEESRTTVNTNPSKECIPRP